MAKVHRNKHLTWEQWYEYAQEYHKQHGDLFVARNYTTTDGKKLGRWIERQRAAYHGKGTYALFEDQIIMLEQLGMQWKCGERNSWDFWFEKAEKYYLEHGNLHVHRNEKVDGYALGNWISEQRKRIKRRSLSEEQRLALEEIGMCWVVQERRPWDDWYQEAVAFYLHYGHLRIPYTYITEDGYALGSWLERQRERYWATGKNYQPPISYRPLSNEQVELLERIGVQWAGRKWKHEKSNAERVSAVDG